MRKSCELEDPDTGTICGAAATWIADVSWPELGTAPRSDYRGTSWSLALCERHYGELLTARRITGTAHRVPAS